MTRQSDYMEDIGENAVAIVGMAGRFPGAPDVERLWEKLLEGSEGLTHFTDEELIKSGISRSLFEKSDYVRVAGRIEDAQAFDADFFGFSPKEARLIDPQQRIFLECVVTALEDAGCVPESFDGQIGVFAGQALNIAHLASGVNAMEQMAAEDRWLLLLGADKDYLATRASHRLNLRGPSLTIQTACSTSLVAVHLACQSLLNGECDVALAGGVSVITSYDKVGYVSSEGDVVSPDGHCRPFDLDAAGTVWGDGVGLVVLKRLDQAIADRDNIRAVIMGSAINNDGSDKAGYMAPSADRQAAVIREAIAVAGLEPQDISYIEAHGTGTKLGDPIEFQGLVKAFGGKSSLPWCSLGSLKGNIGHLNAASGIAGLIKTVLVLEKKFLPRTANFRQINPLIPLEGSPFTIQSTGTAWPETGSPLRAGVSSFGIGGTNAHAVLQEAPPIFAESGVADDGDRVDDHRLFILPLSANTDAALAATSAQLADHLRDHPEIELRDLAHSLTTGRAVRTVRRAIICDSLEGAAADLSKSARILPPQASRSKNTAFLFPGQGLLRGSGGGLYASQPVFRHWFDRCAALVGDSLGCDFRSLSFGLGETAALSETHYAQPVSFALGYALARQWMAVGVEPAGLLGHSLGELTAACLAGVLPLEDAVPLVVARGRLMQAQPRGAMLAVFLSLPLLEPWLVDTGLCIAAMNAPAVQVVSGPTDAIELLAQKLGEAGIASTRLATSHAFHSPAMAPAAAAFAELLGGITLQPPVVPFISNLTGDWITAQQATDPGYWSQHMLSPVRFTQGVDCLLAAGAGALVEVGPQGLEALVRDQAAALGASVTASLGRNSDSARENGEFLGAAARLWSVGIDVKWSQLNPQGRKIPLPTYPFQRRSFAQNNDNRTNHIANAGRGANESSAYEIGWRSWTPHPAPYVKQSWLVCSNLDAISARFIAELRARGDDLVIVGRLPSAADVYGAPGATPTHWLEKADEDGWNHFLAKQLGDAAFGGILYLWPLGAAADQRDCFDTLMALLRATGARQIGSPLELVVVANDSQVIGSESCSNREAALSLGACLALPREWPDARARFVDIDACETDLDHIVKSIVSDLPCDPPHALLAYRGRMRWVRSLHYIGSVSSLERNEVDHLIRPAGTYLITGGLGDLGLVLAQEIARCDSTRIVLLSRRTAPADGPIAEAIEALRAQGAEVMTVAADVNNSDQLGKAIAAARARFGRIDGVIHAAGSAGLEPILNLSQEQIRRVVDPKVLGLRNLTRFFAPHELDFLLLFSSLASLVGYFGHADYAAANAVLDSAIGDAGDSPARRIICANWDAWGEIGMAANAEVPEAMRAFKESRLSSSLSTAEGIDALRLVMAGAFRHILFAKPASLALADTRPAARSLELQDRPALSTQFQPPVSDVECKLAEILAELLQISQVGLDDNFFELGGHSLMGTQLMARVHRDLGVQLPLRVLFEVQTVRGLAEQIDNGNKREEFVL